MARSPAVLCVGGSWLVPPGEKDLAAIADRARAAARLRKYPRRNETYAKPPTLVAQMYQPQLTARDRAATIAMVVALHVGLVFALINLSPPLREQLPQEVVEIFDVTEPPPPEEVVVEEIQAPQEDAPEEEEGAASAENIRSQATPVVAPKPPIQLPVPPPMPVTQTPRKGNERTQGASTWSGRAPARAESEREREAADRAVVPVAEDRAGSRHDRLFSAGSPIAIIRTKFRAFGRGAERCSLQFRVLPMAGQPTARSTDRSASRRSTNGPASWSRNELRFRPATDASGRPVASWFGYVQREIGQDRR